MQGLLVGSHPSLSASRMPIPSQLRTLLGTLKDLFLFQASTADFFFPLPIPDLEQEEVWKGI